MTIISALISFVIEWVIITIAIHPLETKIDELKDEITKLKDKSEENSEDDPKQ